MKRTLQTLGLALAFAGAAFAGALAEETSTLTSYEEQISELSDLLEQATYLAISGFRSYGSTDQAAVAQGLVNLFEGEGGPNVETVSQESQAPTRGILELHEMLRTADRAAWESVLPWSQMALLGDAFFVGEHFIRLAYSSTLEAKRTVYSQIGPRDAFRTAYAHLLAARGGFDDPFLVSGIRDIALVTSDREARLDPSDSIQASIDALPEGGTLYIEPGIYRERLLIDKSISIVGLGEQGDVILEGVNWESVVYILTEESIQVEFENLAIRNGRTGLSVLPHKSESEVSVFAKQLRFERNGTAIALSAVNEDGVVHLSCVESDYLNNGTALVASGVATIHLQRCEIEGTSEDAAITLFRDATLTMSECEIRDSAGIPIWLSPVASLRLKGTTIDGHVNHAILVADRSEGLRELNETEGCGVSMSLHYWNAENLPDGVVSGYGNEIRGSVCPKSLEFLSDPVPFRLHVLPDESIQDAIDLLAEGGELVLSAGTYRENLTIEKSLSVVGYGEISLVPADDSTPTIQVNGAESFRVKSLSLKSAATGIEFSNSSGQVIDCLFQTTKSGCDVIVFGNDKVSFQGCEFSGDGRGVMLVGDGTVAIEACEFWGSLGTGVLVGGTVAVRIDGSTFDECFEGIVLGSTASVTISNNQFIDSASSGIRVSAPPMDTTIVGALEISGNVFENSLHWDISLCGTPDSQELEFQGVLTGSGNMLSGGFTKLCPSDYAWPDGFIVE